MDKKLEKQQNMNKDTSGQPPQEDHDIELLRTHLTTTLSDPSDTKKIKSFVTSPDFVKVLQACGSPTDASASVRAVSFMILTKLFNPETGASDNDTSSSPYPITFIIEQCAQCFSHCLGTGKNVDKLLAYRTLHAIFQTSVTVGAAILCQEGIVEDMMDVVEFEIVDVQVAIMEVLAIASADKSCRKLIIKYASTWLAKVAASRDNDKTDPMLKAAAGTTLTKLSAQNTSQQHQSQQSQQDDAENDVDASLERAMKGVHLDNNDLMENLKKVVTSQTSNSSMMLTAIEGLAYSSVDPGVKEALADDATFLKSLTALSINAASRHSNPLLFGIGTILANITMYRPVLSEQQRQMKKLRDLANAKKSGSSGSAKSKTAAGGDDDDERESDKAVDRRVQKVVDQGCAMALMVLSKNTSVNIRMMAAQTYLNMVTPQSTRGKLLQQGVVKGLVPLAITVDTENNAQELYKTVATQALAKLAITTDPRLAFTSAQMLDLVRPLLTLCKDDNQLRQFEGLMALTNMASMDDQVRYMIDGADGMAVFENLQLSSNDMVQRAATEMVCNMTFFEPVFERYSNPSSPGSQNRIRLLMILSDHEDVATRRAASGALAILANSVDACTMMTNVDKGYERIARLIDENEQVEVQHRGIEIIRCLVNHFGKQGVDNLVKEQGDRKLVQIVKNCQVNAIRGAAMEVLKLFVGHGVELKA